jgi:hypothetical protein
VVTSTSTSPYIGIFRRPARMAAVTSRRLEGNGRTPTWRGRSAAITRVWHRSGTNVPADDRHLDTRWGLCSLRTVR